MKLGQFAETAIRHRTAGSRPPPMRRWWRRVLAAALIASMSMPTAPARAEILFPKLEKWLEGKHEPISQPVVILFIAAALVFLPSIVKVHASSSPLSPASGPQAG